MRPQRLDHLALEVRDLHLAEEFYTRTLGMEVAQRLGGHQVLLKVGDVVLAIMENPRAPRRSEKWRREEIGDPLGKAHLCFLVSRQDFEKARMEWPMQGIPIHGPVNWGDHDGLYFLDPEGNLMEIVAYGKSP